MPTPRTPTTIPGDTPRPARLVAAGVWAVTLPLPATAVRDVNAFLVEHGAGLLLVDAGGDDPAAGVALEAALARIGASVADVTGIVLTHNHPDHVGLAAELRERSGAWIGMHELEVRAGGRPPATFAARLAAELRLAGVPLPVRDEMLELSREFAIRGDALRVDRLLADGDVIEEGDLRLEVLATPGHSPGHVALLDRDRGVLFSGDLVLARGEVQLGLVVTAADDPAGELERSLERVAAVAPALALPGHQEPIRDLAARAREALGELEARLAQTEATVRARPGATAWDVAGAIPWGRPWERLGLGARRYAVMQAAGWLRRLAARGTCEQRGSSPERYRAA